MRIVNESWTLTGSNPGIDCLRSSDDSDPIPNVHPIPNVYLGSTYGYSVSDIYTGPDIYTVSFSNSTMGDIYAKTRTDINTAVRAVRSFHLYGGVYHYCPPVSK